MLARRGKVDEAIADYRKAVGIKPDDAEAHYNLGVLLIRERAAKEAVASLQKALEIKPDFALAQYYLGVVLAGQGQVDEAIAHLQKALEIKPDFEAASDKIAQIRAAHPDPKSGDPEYRVPRPQGPPAKESGGKP
jgi:tetratricopeptide (TPR) repeat protein